MSLVVHYGDSITLKCNEKLLSSSEHGHFEDDLDVQVSDSALFASFQIQPQQLYKDQKRLLKNLSSTSYRIEFTNGLNIALDSDEGLESLLHEYYEERASNLKEIKRKMGNIVRYGDAVHLNDERTRKYLASSPKTLKNNPKALACKLTWILGKDCVFIILPRYKARSNGDPVFIGDKIILKNAKSNGYLFSGAMVSTRPLPSEWQLDIVESFQRDPSFVYAGQLIRIFNDENSSYFSCSRHSKGLGLKTFIFDPSNPVQLDDATVYWKIVAEEKAFLAPLSTGQKFRLFHPLARKYLAVFDGKLMLTESTAAADSDPTLFAFFMQPKKQFSQICCNKKFKLKNIHSKRWIKFHPDQYRTSDYRINNSGENGFVLSRKSPESDFSNSLTVSIVDESRKMMLEYVASVSKTLEIFLSNKQNAITNGMEKLLLKIINSLIFFNNKSKVVDFNISETATTETHQALLQSSGLIDLIFSILDIPNLAELKENPTKFPQTISIFKACYRFLFGIKFY